MKLHYIVMEFLRLSSRNIKKIWGLIRVGLQFKSSHLKTEQCS